MKDLCVLTVENIVLNSYHILKGIENIVLLNVQEMRITIRAIKKS